MKTEVDNAIEITYQATKKITLKDMADLLTTALEGGSGYWIDFVDIFYPKGHTSASYKEGGEFEDKHSYGIPVYNVWMYDGGYLKIHTEDEVDNKKVFVFDMKAIKKGFELMSKGKATPIRHWNDFVNDNYDADTADVFLQLALFGEVIFG